MYQTQVETGENPGTYFTKAVMFDRNLDQIKQAYLQHWNPDLEINLDSAKLYLYAFTFMCSAPDTPPRALRVSAEQSLIQQKALIAASHLISSMTDLSLSSSPNTIRPAGLLTFYPEFHFKSLYFAAIFLFRILVSGQTVSSHDKKEMVSLLQAAHKIFQSFPEQRDHTRAAISIEVLVQILREEKSPERKPLESLVVEDRLGASLMFDALFRVWEERNRHDSKTPSQVASWKSMTEQFHDRLPRAPIRPVTPRSTSISLLADAVSTDGESLRWWESWDAYLEDFGIGYDFVS